MMNIKQLKEALTQAEISFPNKARKAELEALLEAATAPTAKPRKARVSTKEILRSMFENVGDEKTVQEVLDGVAAHTEVAPATITTMIGDLRNEKYCGPKGLFDIQRSGDVYTRVDPKS